MSNILVIDDDAAIRMTVRAMLEMGGHRVTEAADGRYGIAALSERPADLVIVDIFMPNMDGFETLMSLRAAKPSLPVIVMSGSRVDPLAAQPDFLKMAGKLGAITTLHKPFRAAELLAAVGRALETTA